MALSQKFFKYWDSHFWLLWEGGSGECCGIRHVVAGTEKHSGRLSRSPVNDFPSGNESFDREENRAGLESEGTAGGMHRSIERGGLSGRVHVNMGVGASRRWEGIMVR